jgi:hypothetical protein
MNRSTRKAFEAVEADDHTLSMDGVSDFLSRASDRDVDPTLAVSGLEELFPVEASAPCEVPAISGWDPPSSDGASAGTGGLAEYFTALENAPAAPVTANDSVLYPEDLTIDIVDVAPEDLGFQSEIQRAAMDFQRFAEKFHAFARQCQAPRAAFARPDQSS